MTGILAAIFFLWILSYPFISLDVDKKNAFLEVKKGDNLTQVANKLVKKNILSNIFRFKLLAKLSNRSESIKSGHYNLHYDISPNELLTLLENGEGVLYPITFIEGTGGFGGYLRPRELIRHAASMRSRIMKIASAHKAHSTS